MAEASESQKEFQLDIDIKDHALGLLRKFNRMRTQRKECDLVIKAEGKEIHAHRNVMMAGSDFFDAMFTHDMEEKQTGVAEMKDISFKIMQKLVVFIYTGKISLFEDECDELLFASRMLQLTSVCQKIAQFLESHLSPKSFFNVRRIAVKFDVKSLVKFCDYFALENLHLLVKEEEFNKLELSYIEFLTSAKALDENSKLAVICQWIKADAENRRQDLLKLTSLLSLENISPGYGRHIAENEEIFYGSHEFMRRLYLSGISKHAPSSLLPNIKGASFSEPNSVVVFDKASASLQTYKAESRSWSKLHDLHKDMLDSKYTAVATQNSIYVLMGNKKAYKINFLESGVTWTPVADMRYERNYLRAAVLDEHIYVGGEKTMERFNRSLNKWESVECGSFHINECELVALKDCIYVIGGLREGPMKNVSEFCGTSQLWSPVSPMLVARRTPAGAACGNNIYVAGGCGNGYLSAVEFYDLDTKVWTMVQSMINSHDEFRLFHFNNNLFAVGHRDQGVSNCIEVYDFEVGKWKILDQLEEMEIESCASVACFLP